MADVKQEIVSVMEDLNEQKQNIEIYVSKGEDRAKMARKINIKVERLKTRIDTGKRSRKRKRKVTHDGVQSKQEISDIHKY